MQWATPIAAFILGMICFGIDEIGVELEDPLGNDRNDMEMWEVIKRLDKELALLCVMNPGTDEPFDLRTFFRSLFNLLFVVKDDFYLFLFSFLSLFYPPTWSAPSSSGLLQYTFPFAPPTRTPSLPSLLSPFMKLTSPSPAALNSRLHGDGRTRR